MNTELRKSRNRRLAIWLIGVPMVVAAIYYTFFAADRYVSATQVTVRQSGHNDVPQLSGLAVMLAGGVNPASREETLYLREFITSIDMLNFLEEKVQWKEHYAGRWLDPLYLVFKNASAEFWLWYYQRMVTAQYDEETGLLRVEVQAFSPEFAQQSLKLILAESDRFVNEISHRMAREQVAFAESELESARKNYEKKREELLRFQSENGFLDAQASAESRAGVISELETALIHERANLKGLLGTLNPNSPQVRQSRNRIAALEQQLAVENKRLVSPPNGGHLNVVAARYRNLTIDAGIAEDAYKYSVNALEAARIDAVKKIRSLVTVVTPNAPDLALYPRKIYNLITLLIGLLLFYGVVRFVIATIEDHRD